MLANFGHSFQDEIEELKTTQEQLRSATELEDLRHENELFKAVLNNFPGGITLFDKNLRMILCNKALKEMLEYPESLFEFGQPSLEQIFRFNALRGEYGPGDIEEHVASKMKLVKLSRAHVYERRRPNGTVLEVRGVPLTGGGFLTSYTDITNQRSSHQKNLQSSNLDELTGLPKIDYISKRVSELLATMATGDVASVHCLDLDHFTALNAEYGKKACDFILQEVANRLTEVVRINDCLARIGGDRFLILQTNVTRPPDVVRLATRLVEVIKKPILYDNKTIHVSSSVGIALAPRDGRIAHDLIAKATADVVQVKKRQRNN